MPSKQPWCQGPAIGRAFFFSPTLKPWSANGFDPAMGHSSSVCCPSSDNGPARLLQRALDSVRYTSTLDRAPASALTDGGCDRKFAWVEESFPAIEVSAEGFFNSTIWSEQAG
jgi:hypothetical protein